MSLKDLDRANMPATDIAEIAYRLTEVRHRLEEVCDDWTCQEMYDCIGYQSAIIAEIADDLGKIFGVLTMVAG